MKVITGTLFGLTEERSKELYIFLIASVLVHGMCDNCGNHPNTKKTLDYLSAHAEEVLGTEFFIMPSELAYIYFQLGQSLDDIGMWISMVQNIDLKLGYDHVCNKLREIMEEY